MTHLVDSDNVVIHSKTKEYLRLYFTTDVETDELGDAKVAFSRGTNGPLGDEPDWIPATIETDHLRILFGEDVSLSKGIWTVYATFTANPEIPVEKVPGYLRVL